MHRSKSSFSQRWFVFGIIISIAWTLMSVSVSADMSFQVGDKDTTQQFWLKDGRIRMFDSETLYLFDCVAGDFAMLAPDHKRYWRGTVDDFRDEMNALFAMMDPSAEPSDFFSTINNKQVAVRTTRVGPATMAGHDTIHYVVEYEENGRWTKFEEVWVAPTLLAEIEAETGPCMNTIVHDLLMTMVQLQLGDWLDDNPMWSVITSPEYRALSEEGFTVRNLSVVEVAGMHFETISEIKELSRDPLDDALFVIPDDYESMTLLEAIM